MQPSSSPRAGHNIFVWLLLVAIALLWAYAIPSINYNPDEGVNILTARRIQQGQRPLVDFFYHQPPVYLYFLATATNQPLSYIAARALSYVALLATAGLIFLLLRHQGSQQTAVRATLLFLLMPLHGHSVLALPNALMVCLSYASVYCIAQGHRSWHWAIAGMLLATAVYIKPLALASGIGVGLALLFWRRITALAYFVLFFLSSMVVFLLAINGLSGGNFIALLFTQVQRFTKVSLVEKLQAFPPFVTEMQRRGVDSMLGWNSYEHYRTFLPIESPWLIATFLLLLLFFGGLYIVRHHRDQHSRWLARVHASVVFTELFFSLFIWAPIWDHYMLQYLPSMAVISAYAIAKLTAKPAGRWFDLLLTLLTALTVVLVAAQRMPYNELKAKNLSGQAVLSFDPFVNVVSNSQPGCDLDDPLNRYGDSALVRITMVRRFDKFYISEADVIDCINKGNMQVLLTPWSEWFLTPQVKQALAALPPTAFVFNGLWPSGVTLATELAPKNPE